MMFNPVFPALSNHCRWQKSGNATSKGRARKLLVECRISTQAMLPSPSTVRFVSGATRFFALPA